ncbi:acyltransferase family protein [Noviherbaspirillum soli]|uniref:acyltransferase family protein n=1 Tax=Noviherbaspirillum soli TaxID=1064518 RepID=UPI00188B022F|nr:acyltransferase [Noviherbaspirillum soli]
MKKGHTELEVPPAHTRNAFDFIRFIAAFGVLYSHSFPLTGLPDHKYFAGLSIGALCVFVFFSISGALVMRSWERSPNLYNFLRNRILRIFPGLFVCLIFSAFLVGPFVSTQPFADYVVSLSPYQYVLSGLIMFTDEHSTIQNVFSLNPYPNTLNGSLWTIRYEVFMYLVLAVLCVTFRRKTLAIGTMLFVFIVVWFSGKFSGMYDPGEIFWRLHVVGMGGALLKIAPFFLIGALLARTPREGFRPLLAVVGLVVTYFFKHSDYGIAMLWAALPYAVLTAAYHLPKIFNRFGKYGDFSYGIYLYAFPVQQTLTWCGITVVWQHVVLSTFITLLLAVLSWKLIESPVLQIKQRNRTVLSESNSPLAHGPGTVSQ